MCLSKNFRKREFIVINYYPLSVYFHGVQFMGSEKYNCDAFQYIKNISELLLKKCSRAILTFINPVLGRTCFSPSNRKLLALPLLNILSTNETLYTSNRQMIHFGILISI